MRSSSWIETGIRWFGEAGGGQEVFQGRQFFLDGIVVAEVAEIGAEFVGESLDRFAFPADFAGFRRQQ
ncbi:MAG TPA: hypothetical protein PLR99_15385, partial [Polyangiaceae bacterium]|nr:hypothetical protein [Polyangiaceae bacterium]